MARLFGHYIPFSLIVLALAEASVAFASVFVGRWFPVVGLAEIRPAWGSAIPAGVALSLLLLGTAHVAGLHTFRLPHGRRELLVRLTAAFGAAYLLLAMFGYLLPALALGRKAFLVSFATAFPVTLGLHLAHGALTRRHQRRRKILLLGAGPIARMIAATVEQAGHTYELAGCLTANGHAAGADGAGLRAYGTIEDLNWVAALTRPDVIVVTLEERRGALPVSAIVECKLKGIEVDDWPSFYEKLTGKIPVHDLRPSWLVFADGFRPARLTVLAKRAIDLAASLTGCLLSLPVMLAVALAIKLDSPGPVFFRQERLGQFGRTFSVLKFRSMRAHADLMPPPAPGEPDGRVTRIGGFLRRTRLDELPQLINVLLGQMSLVGPRPEWVALVPQFEGSVPFYLHRLAVKPGITGWAQVNNPYGATVENTLQKLQYDLYYIKNLSIFLDLLILLHTIQIVFFTRGSGEWTTTRPAESTTSASYAG
jgi:sugar transferase (PEP-CTERM system associated)